MPALLLQTGAFSNLSTLATHAGIVAYQVNLPFWSDHAEKQRWFSIPDALPTMQWARDANWQFPDGQVWIKHFDIEAELGNPASKRRLETRFLVKNPTGAYGVTYRWRDDQSDADLVAASGLDELLPSSQTWRFPSRSECMTCQTSAGLSDWQPWNVPGNTPDFPATGGGVKIIGGTRDGTSRFFRANFSSP